MLPLKCPSSSHVKGGGEDLDRIIEGIGSGGTGNSYIVLWVWAVRKWIELSSPRQQSSVLISLGNSGWNESATDFLAQHSSMVCFCFAYCACYPHVNGPAVYGK